MSSALGRAISTIRRERGLTQKELALGAELDETDVSLIEGGRGNPTWGEVRRISYALDIPLRDLALLAEEFERKP